MAILTGTMHCPCCGGTDPSDWRESAGTPTWCLNDTATIAEECDENCQHLELDELNEALAMLGPTSGPRKWEYPVGGCTIGDHTHQHGVTPDNPHADPSPFRPAPAWLADAGHPWLVHPYPGWVIKQPNGLITSAAF